MRNNEKVTLTLPRGLMQTVRMMAPARGHSKFIAEAIDHYIRAKKRKALREELIAGYQATAEESLAITKEWEIVDEEVWSRNLPNVEKEEADDAPDKPG